MSRQVENTVIKGLTDKKSDREILGRIEITVFKGERKGERSAGKSLEDKYRITSKNRQLLDLLKSYGMPNANGDILTNKIRVIFPFDEPQRTFNTSMKAYSASGLEVVCDRSTITQKVAHQKDAKGNAYRPIKECSEPCPVADEPMGVKCQHGCQPTGEFYFYIRELFEVGMMIPCKMTVHSYSDIAYIHSYLERVRAEIGSITNSPFPCYITKNKVPFILTRSQVAIKRPVVSGKEDGYKRTGKKSDAITWAVQINLDREYLNLFQAWKQVEEMKRLNLKLPQSAIAGLLQCNPNAIIDVEVVEEDPPKALPSRADKMRSRILELADTYEQHTGVVCELPDIEIMDEEELLSYGKSLKEVIDKLFA